MRGLRVRIVIFKLQSKLQSNLQKTHHFYPVLKSFHPSLHHRFTHHRLTTYPMPKTAATTSTNPSSTRALDWVAYGFAALSLLVVLKCGLIVALFSGLLIYALAHTLAPYITAKAHNQHARTIAVVMLLGVLVLTVCGAVFGAMAFFKSESGSLPALLQKLSNILAQSRQQLPDWLVEHLPTGIDELKTLLTEWISKHIADAKTLSQEVGHIVVQLIIGTIIGSMVALQTTQPTAQQRPLTRVLTQRVANLATVFQKVVFAQVQISLINTVFTALFLMAVLPLLGVALPLTKTLVAITFFAGLIPVVGNIMSNSAIVLVGLSVSVPVALGSLLFMVVIHKLEYFLNAKIIGAQIKAKAWEMLCAILLMETLFGLAGVVAAPVFYAYVKKELMDKELV
jgi:predicted PurR-regulated permease PerM